MVRSEGIGTLFQEISNTGAEIGIHNDLLTVMIQDGIDPLEFNRQELEYYKSLGITIHGTASHGSDIAKKSVPNFEIFSDFAKKDTIHYDGRVYKIGRHSLKDFGYEYEAYFVDHKLYLSDSGGRWNDKEGLKGILKELDASKPGDRIEILVHPDWWGKTAEENN
jgi:hypothetical protein